MIISLRFKNFFSFRDEVALDFTTDNSLRKKQLPLEENIIEFSGDRFVNIIGMFGSNAAGKSNVIKALDFCRNTVLTSHLNNEGSTLEYEPFKFDKGNPSEFYIDFVTGGIEYEYSFQIFDGNIINEELYHYPNKRKARVFRREKTYSYTHRKGVIQRPTEVEANTGSKTLFLSRASSMNRPIARTVYRFFLNEIVIGLNHNGISDLTFEEFDLYKDVLLKAFEVSDSDIVDIMLREQSPGVRQLLSFHRENPSIPFDFDREESEGTKRLLFILLLLLKKSQSGASIFIDEFDLKLHLRLAEFLLDVIRASKGTQMVFTTHNPNLINPSKLLREQIVFVNKQQDGNSELTPLSDFEAIGKNTDIQKAYLQGRFDAVPYIGNIYPVLSQLINKYEDKKI